jgi:hypothetical protein
VAVLGPTQDTQELAVSTKKTMAVLQIAPSFGDLSGDIKNYKDFAILVEFKWF